MDRVRVHQQGPQFGVRAQYTFGSNVSLRVSIEHQDYVSLRDQDFVVDRVQHQLIGVQQLRLGTLDDLERCCLAVRVTAIDLNRLRVEVRHHEDVADRVVGDAVRRARQQCLQSHDQDHMYGSCAHAFR